MSSRNIESGIGASFAQKRKRNHASLDVIRRASRIEGLERRLLLAHVFTSAEAATLEDGLTRFGNWTDELSTQRWPMASQLIGVDSSIGELAGLKDAWLNQIVQPVTTYLSTPGATDEGLGTMLRGLSASLPGLAVAIGQDTSPQSYGYTGGGEIAGSDGASYEYGIYVTFLRTTENVPLDLGEQWRLQHMAAGPGSTVTMSCYSSVSMTFGLGEANYTPAPNAFYMRFASPAALRFDAEISGAGALNLNFPLNAGMLATNVVGGSVDILFGRAECGINNSNTLTADQLETTPLNTLTTIPVDDDGHPYVAGGAKITLPLQVSDSTFLPSTASPTITLDSWADFNGLFDPFPTVMTGNSDYRTYVQPFTTLTPQDLIGPFQQIATSLGTVINGSPLTWAGLPFAPSTSLAGILDFSDTFKSDVSDVLSAGGLPTFQTVQELQSIWATALGVDPSALSYHFTPGSDVATWHISLGAPGASSTAPLNLSSGLSPLTLTSTSGTVNITANGSFSTDIGIRLQPLIATIEGAASMPANGQFAGTAQFTLQVGDDAPVSFSIASDPTIVGIDDLVSRFRKAVAGTPLWGKVNIERDGLRLRISTSAGYAAPKIVLHADPHNVMVTQFGFTDGQSDTPDASSQVFLQNASVSGSLAGTVSGVSASGRLGMLGVGVAGGSGSMNLTGGFALAGSSNGMAGSAVTADDLRQNASTNPVSFTRGLTLDGNASLTLPITVNGGFLDLPAGAAPTVTVNWTHAPNPATLSLSYNSDMSPLLDFTKIKSGDIISSLGGISSLLGFANEGSLLSQKLPLVDKSLVQMLDLANAVSGKVGAVSLGASSSIQQIGPAIESAFSLPPGSVTVTMSGHLLRISFDVTASASGSQSLQVDLDKLVADLPDSDPVKGFLQGMSKLVASGAGGSIAYSANATLHVAAGVDLTDAAHPKPFIDDSTHAAVSVQVNGTNLSFGATMGPLGVTVKDGSVKIGATTNPSTVDAASFSVGVASSPLGRHYLSEINGSAFDVSLTGAMRAILPLYFPLASDHVGDLDISISNLADIPASLSINAPDIHSIGLNMDLSNNMDGLLEGLGMLLDQIQASLGEQVLSTKLPLVGDKLGQAVDFIGNALRTNVYSRLKAAFDDAAAHGAAKGIDVARQGLYAALGPGGLNVLKPAAATPYGDYRDIDYETVGSGIDTQRVEFKLHLHKSATLVSVPLNFDLGLPALGLSATGSIQLAAGYDINLWFGVDREDGFFLDTSSPQEVKLDINASIPGATLTGNLAFLRVQLSDNPADPTHFGGNFTIDLNAPGDELTLGDFGSIVGSDFVDAHLAAEAKVDLNIVTSFGGSAVFPSLDANFILDWKFSPTDPDLNGGVPEIAFKNVRIDAGSFFSSFLGPIVQKVKDVIDPIEPILDVLTAHIPGLYDVAPSYGTLVDIAEQFGLVEGADAIKALASIAQVVSDLPSVEGGHLYINLGDFDLGGLDPRSPLFNAATVEPNITHDVGDPSSQLPAETQSFWQETQDLGSAGAKMEFPLLSNPKDAFRLLLGQDVNLFTLDLPAIHLGFKSGVRIPVYSVGVATVYLTLGGSLDVQGKVAFGYDTYGLRQFVSSHNAVDIFDGFYISTRQNADGTGGEMPFLSAWGELKAGLALDFASIVAVGAEGGLGFSVGASLQDPNHDGKLHISEMVQEIGEGFFSTVKITGSIYALFDVYIEFSIPLTPFHYTWELVNIKATLVEVSSVHPGIEGDRFAPNTRRASAADIGVGPGIHLTNLSIAKSEEQDWFHFELPRIDNIDIAVNAGFSSTMEIYDKDGTLIATSEGGAGLKTLTFENMAADTYFIHVVGDGTSTGYYSLSIDPSATSSTHVYYVSTMVPTTEPFYTFTPGVDANDGLTPWTPKATLQALLSAYTLGANDIVLIDTGRYDEAVILSSAIAGAIIAGSPRGSIYRNAHAWTINGASGLHVMNLQFECSDSAALGSTAIQINSGSDNVFDRLMSRNYDTGVDDAGTRTQLLGLQIQGASGIDIQPGATGTIVRSNSLSIEGYGIDDRGSNTVLDRNFVGKLKSINGATGIRVAGTNTQVTGNTLKGMLCGMQITGGGTTLISGNMLTSTDSPPPMTIPIGIDIGGTGSLRLTQNSVRSFQINIRVARQGTTLDTNVVYGGSTGIQVDANNVTIGPNGEKTSGNDVSHSGTGIDILNTVTGVLIFDNRVHDNQTGIDNPTTTLIYGNEVFANYTGIISAGIVGASDWSDPNRIHDNTVGVSLTAATELRFNRIYSNVTGVKVVDNDYVHHNVFYRNTGQGLSDIAHSGLQFINNTVYITTGKGLEITAGASGSTVKNNILMADGGGTGLYISNDSQLGLVSDYNNFYRTGAGVILWFEKPFADVYDWQIESDYDLHSIGYIAPTPALDNPQFVDLANDNFHVAATSSSINAGSLASAYNLEPADNGGRIDLGAYGNTVETQPSATSCISIDYPRMYVDWEANRARNIQWHAYNLTGNVRIELWLEGGGKVTDIATVPVSDGTYLWSPNNSGIAADPLKRYRIKIVSTDTPSISATAREFFSVPPYSANYYINDGSTAGDEYTTAIGDNRNSGRAANAPKADLLPILRTYVLTANETIHVDTGSYYDVRNLVINYNTDSNSPNAGTGLGDDQGFAVAGPLLHSAILDRATMLAGSTHVDVDAASFISLSHLTFLHGSAGIAVHGGSRNFSADHVGVGGTGGDGVWLDASAIDSTLDALYVSGNAGYGVYSQAHIASLSNSTIANSGRDGIRLQNADGVVVQRNVVYGNAGDGINVSVGSTQGALIGSVNLADNAGNIVHDNLYNGINVYGSAPGGSTIAGNVVYGQTSSWGAGIYSTGGDYIALNVAHDNPYGIYVSGNGARVDRNRVYANTRAGIRAAYTDGTISYNTVSGSVVGIWADEGRPTISNNTLASNAEAGVRLDGVVEGYAATGTPPHAMVLSNSFWQGGGVAVDVLGRSAGVEIRNNIMAALIGIAVADDSQSDFVSDYNLFYCSGAVGSWQSVNRNSLTDWRNAIYGDVHSLYGDPIYVNAAGGDLHLQSAYGSNHGGSFAPVLNSGTGLPMANPGTWIADGATSPAVDRGDGALDYSQEPSPNGNYANLGAESNTAYASRSPTSYVLVTSPSNGVVWPEGQTYDITWRTQDAAGTVTIDLYKGGLLVRTLALAAANSGTFSWTLPSDLTSGSDYSVRVTRNDGSGTTGTSQSTFVIAPVTHTYYVNDWTVNAGDLTLAAGDDSKDGLSPSSPKGSIRAVLFAYHLLPGDTIVADAGTYGLSRNIMLDAAADGVTITGPTDPSRPAILDRQNTSNGSYVFEMAGGTHVTLAHLTMIGGSRAVYSSSGVGASYLTISNSLIHGNSWAGIDLSNADHVLIQGNTIAQQTGETQQWHILLSGSDNTITSNTITGLNGNGIGMNLSGVRLNVSGNVLTGLTNGIQLQSQSSTPVPAGETTIVSGNLVHDVSGSGMVIGTWGYYYDALVVTSNTVYNTNPAWPYAGISINGPLGSIASGNTVYNSNYGIMAQGSVAVRGNVVYANATGIYAYGNIAIQGNTVHDNAVGISGGGPIVNNTIYGNTTSAVLIYSNGGLSNGATPVVLNNTIYQLTGGSGITLQSSSSHVDIRNNIIVMGAGAAYNVAGDSQASFNADYNIIRTTGSGSVATWGASGFATLAAWSGALGFDSHSANVDPQFANAAAGNFHLQDSSPAIDAGDPASYCLAESQPNGNRANIGADGNTAQANTSASPAIQVTAPAGGEQLQEGQSYTVTWQSGGLSYLRPVAFINSGGPTVGRWLKDTYITATGSMDSWNYGAVDLSGVSGPAPASVYQSAAFTYASGAGATIGYNLPVPDGTYILRLHFVEPYQYATASSRRFNIVVNGVTVRADYSIYGTAGATLKADTRQFTVNASSGTGLQIQLVGLTDASPIISGVELASVNADASLTPHYNVDVSVDNGAHWTSAATNVAGDPYGFGSTTWTAGPASDGNAALLRVTSVERDTVVGQTPQPFQIAPSGHSFYINDGSATGDEYTTAIGNDLNSGKMPNRPMATLSALLAAYSPHAGDTIYVDSGTYNPASNIQLLAAYSGVRIVGPTSHQAILNRNNTSSNAYVFQITGANNITLDHLTLTGAYEGIHTDYSYSTPNSTGLTVTNCVIYGNSQYGIYLQSGNTFASISGNTIYGIPGSWPVQTNQYYGVYITSTDNTVSTNHIYSSGTTGIYISGDRNTASGNIVHDSATYGIYAYGKSSVTGNTVYGQSSAGAYGVYASSGSYVSGNTVYSNVTGIMVGSVGTIVSDNVVYNNTTGINTAPASQVLGNTVYSNSVGILITGSADLTGKIAGNLVYANSTVGIRTDGASYSSYDGSHTVIVGNTVYQPTATALEIQNYSKYVEVRNNILDAGAGYAFRVSGDSTTGLFSDYNLVNAFGSAKLGQFSGVDFTSLDAWYYATLADDHSVYGDPGFIDPDGADNILGFSGANHGADDNFHLQGNSIAIDGGDPASPYSAEPQSNGGRVNIGYDGNTAQAAASPASGVILRNPSGHTRLTVGKSVAIRWGSYGLTQQSPVALINAGGSAVGMFCGNLGQTTGSTGQIGNTIDTSGIIDPAPAGVYSSYAAASYGVGQKLTYVIPVPDGTYTLRLHFLDTYYSVGNRKFDIRLNGTTVRAAYDIAADAGAAYRVAQQTFTTTASGGNGITLDLVNVTANAAMISAIEVLRDNPAGSASPTFNVQVSTDGGGSWGTVGSNLSVDHLGEGSFNWTPTTASNNARIRIISGSTQSDFGALVIAPAGHDYYVNDSSTSGDTLTTAVGSNTNSGKSVDQPMASLAALLAIYHPTTGDVVHVDNGSYTVVRNILLASDISGVTIVGPTSGAATLNRAFTTSGQAQTAAFQLAGATGVTLDRLAITGADYGVYAPSSSSYVTSNLTISNSTIYNNAMYGVWTGQYINSVAVINGLFYGTGSGAQAQQNGIRIDGSDSTISGAIVHHSYTGIAVSGTHALVQNNTVYATTTAISESGSTSTPGTVISGNTVYNNSGVGISSSGTTTSIIGNTVYGQTTSTGITVAGQAIGNTVYNNSNGIAGSTQSVISGNRVFHNANYGISTRGNGRVSGNRVYSNSIGIQTEPGYTQFAGAIENNLVYVNSSQGILINYAVTSYQSAQVNNNTVFQPVGDALRIQGNSANLSIRNNLLQANSGYAIYMASDSQGANITSDRNLFVLPSPTNSRAGYYGGIDRSTLSAWQSASGRDARSSSTTDAKFVSTVGADNVFAYDTTQNIDGGADDNFQVSAGSPAIDRGTEWAGPTTDILNHARVDDPGTTNAGSNQIVLSQLSSSLFTAGGVSQGWSGSYTYWTLNLPFAFPFYDQSYSQVYVSSAGYLQFGTTSAAGDNGNSTSSLMQYARIAPLWDYLNTSAVYVDTSTANQITIRWSGTQQNYYPYTAVNFAATLFANGDIRFDYGSANANLSPTVGISMGDSIHYKLAQYDGSTSLNNARSLLFDRSAASFTDIGAYEFSGNSADTTPTAITGATPTQVYDSGAARLPINYILVNFNHALSAVDAQVASLYDLRNPGTDGIYGTSDDIVWALMPQYTADSTQVRLNIFGGPLPQGSYRLTVYGTNPRALHDVAGQVIDGDANGTAGGDFARGFVMSAPAVAPVVSLAAPSPINEGVLYQASGSFTDSDTSDSWTATVNYGDGSGTLPLALDDEGAFILSHSYADSGTYTITVTVTDSFGLSGSASVVQTVNEVAPIANLTSNSPVNEGSVATISFDTPFDPSSADTAGGFRYSYDFNDDGVFDLVNSTSASANIPASCIPAGGGSIMVRGRITTSHDGVGTIYTTTITINNVPPTIAASLDATINTTNTYSAAGSFADPGSTFSATVDYGDGAGLQSLTLLPNRTFQLSHNYAAAGVYTVTVAISDGIDTATRSGTVTVNAMTPLVAAGVDITGQQNKGAYLIVAVFTPLAGSTLSDYTAQIDWGDGYVDTGDIEDNGDGTFAVWAWKGYYSTGSFDIETTITSAGASAVVHSTATITEPLMDPPHAYDFYAEQFQQFSGYLGYVRDPVYTVNTSVYSLMINWGDGTSSAGWFYHSGYNHYLYGSHTYSSFGDYPLTLTVQKNVAGQPLQTVSTSATASVANAALYGNGVTVTAEALSPVQTVVARFYDSDPAGHAGLYTATINWGDGNTSAGIVMDDPDNPGQLIVVGTADYQLAGSYTVSVDIVDAGDGVHTSVLNTASSAQVAAAPLQVSVAAIQAIVGQPFSGQVAIFGDPNLDGPQSVASFTAVILWGDGTQSAGTITQLTGKTFAVSGSHTYALPGSLPVQVVISTVPIANPVANGGFEGGLDGWTKAGSYLPSAYSWGHTGEFSVRLGDSNYNDSSAGESVLTQDIVVPAGNSMLEFWVNRYSWTGYGDTQYARILDTSGNILSTIFSTLVSDDDWTRFQVDLSAFAGQTIRLQLGVSLNGDSRYSYMLVDDVSVARTDKSGDASGLAQVRATATVTLAAPPANILYTGKTNVVGWAVASVVADPGMPTPTGAAIVRFYVGSSASGTPMSSKPVFAGTYTAVATYAGDSNYAPASSAPVTFPIGRASTTTTLAAPPASITYTGDNSVTNWVVATVAGVSGAPAPTGTPVITYFAGASATGSPLAAKPVGPGTYTIVASYGGNSDYQPSVSAPVTFTINPSTSPVTTAFQVNDGSVQRSMVRSLQVTFSTAVTLQSGAITLVDSSGAAVASQLSTSDNTTWTLTFTGPQFVGGSLADGQYTLAVHAALVSGTGGAVMSADQSYAFWRLYGDLYGQGVVNASDVTAFTKAYQGGAAAYVAAFDYNNDGVISIVDYARFRTNVGRKV